ncbi:hypothetical protein UNH65_20735 [Chitinophaga sp. 180180018-2]|nr:hypothetical protein [Chitinophaga sp. 212800010-3]
MKNIVLTLVATLLLFSCKSTKNYEQKEIRRIATNYQAIINSDINRSSKSRRDIKRGLEMLEYRVALSADSIVFTTQDGQTHVDSFYYNPHKIQYIRQHSLITPGKILMTKGKP